MHILKNSAMKSIVLQCKPLTDTEDTLLFMRMLLKVFFTKGWPIISTVLTNADLNILVIFSKPRDTAVSQALISSTNSHTNTHTHTQRKKYSHYALEIQ